MESSKPYFNLLYINPLGNQILARRMAGQALYKLSNGYVVPEAVIKSHYDFVQTVDRIESARLRVRIHGRKKSARKPVYERNINGFKVVVGYQKVDA